MCSATTDAGVSCWFMASSVVGSTPWAMTTLPAGAAAAWSGTRRVRVKTTTVRHTPIENLLMRGDRLRLSPANLGFPRQGVKVRERLGPCRHPAERLSLPHPREPPADGGARGKAAPGHDVRAPHERRPPRAPRLLRE